MIARYITLALLTSLFIAPMLAIIYAAFRRRQKLQRHHRELRQDFLANQRQAMRYVRTLLNSAPRLSAEDVLLAVGTTGVRQVWFTRAEALHAVHMARGEPKP